MGTPSNPSTSNNPTPNGPDEHDGKTLKEYTTDIQDLSGRISSLQKSAFTLANYYFVSQAVIFTALSSNSSLMCRDVWFPLFLSLLPGALNLFAFFMIGQEYIETECLRKVYIRKKRELTVQEEQYLQRRNYEQDGITERKKIERLLSICMCAFGFLAAVVAVGSLWMLCGESIIVKHNAKCVKLCN